MTTISGYIDYGLTISDYINTFKLSISGNFNEYQPIIPDYTISPYIYNHTIPTSNYFIDHNYFL